MLLIYFLLQKHIRSGRGEELTFGGLVFACLLYLKWPRLFQSLSIKVPKYPQYWENVVKLCVLVSLKVVFCNPPMLIFFFTLEVCFFRCSLYKQLLSFPGHHSGPHLCRSPENAAHTGTNSLALEKLSSKLGGKRDIYEVIVSHGSRNMIKDLNRGAK